MMEKKRNIAMVVQTVSFVEAEEDDDIFYASLSPEKRLEMLMDLRRTIFGNRKRKIQKIVHKRSMYEAADN